MTASGKRWIGAGLVAAWMALAPARAADARSQAPPDFAQQDLQALAARLNDPGAAQDQRDEAARRLVSRRSPEARRIVAETLVNLNPGGQLAAARALADDPEPTPAMIDPLLALLGTNRPLTEAAAQALAAYNANPAILARLTEFVRRRPPNDATRTAVIRAIGRIPEKVSAQFLLETLGNANESPAGRRAASEALAELSGLPAGGEDPTRWSQWWSEQSQKDDDQFRADLLMRRSGRLDRLSHEFDQLAAETEAILKEQYRAASAAQRPDLLMRHLRSSQPQVHTIAAGIVEDEALDNKPPAAVTREQLREMIGDSSPAVRASVANVMAKINDAAAFEALLAQLAQEPEAAVRAALARALAPIGDLRAVPLLLAMLDDPSYDAARAAASALRVVGPAIRDNDPALAQRTATALRQALERRTGSPQAQELREDLVGAMVPLRQEQLLPMLTAMLDERRGETIGVRRLAVRGIGEIANPQSAGVLDTALRDRSELVRLEAVQALSESPALAENAEALRDLLDPLKEPDEPIRLAAWRALETVFPSLPMAQLNIWSDRFKDDPARRLIVLKALAEQQIKARDEDGLCTTRENIAAAHMALKQYPEAAEYFRLALEFKKTQSVPEHVIETLIRNLMEALLLARDFQTATEFAAQCMRDNPANAQVVAPRIWAEAQRLRDASEHQAALDLIAAAAQMDPALPEKYRTELATIEKEVQQKKSQQNATTTPPGPRTAGARSEPKTSSAGD